MGLGRLWSRGRKTFVAALVAVVVASGGAYALASEAFSGAPQQAGFPPPASAADLRASLAARLGEVGRPDLAPAPESALHMSRAVVDGAVWVFASYRNRAGQQCVMEAVPGEGRGFSCRFPKALIADGPLFITWGSRQNPGGSLTEWDVAWVTGFAAPPLKSVELVSTDCSARTLEIAADGSFFAVSGEEAMHGGAWPHLIRGLSAHGKVIAERRIELEVPNARDDIIRGPQPGSACRAGQ